MFERKIEDIRVFAMEKMAEMESNRERMWEQDEMIRRAQEEIKCVAYNCQCTCGVLLGGN